MADAGARIARGPVDVPLAALARRTAVKAAHSVEVALGADVLVARWAIQGQAHRNFGDKLNPLLIQGLSGRRVFHESTVVRPLRRQVFLVVGSLLNELRPHYTVWGAGFLSSEDRVIGRPRGVHAVRGPLSRRKLIDGGVACPDVFGDPALLCPLFYRPRIEPQYDLGIVCHYRDAVKPPTTSDPRVRWIDITGSVHQVIDDLVSCRRVASSSLHGLVVAHAYGIPAVWVRFSDRPLGDGFKFRDYWASMGRDRIDPLEMQPDTPWEPLLDVPTRLAPRVDARALIEACPFLSDEQKVHLQTVLGGLHAGVGAMV